MFYFFLSKGVTNVLLITKLLYYVEPVIKPLTHPQKISVLSKKTEFFIYYFLKLVVHIFLAGFSLWDVVQFTSLCILQFKMHICEACLFLRRQILKCCKTAVANPFGQAES